MSRTDDGTRSDRSQSGFTLLELLLVMIIASLATASILVLYRGPSSDTELRAAALMTASRFRDLRVTAVETGTQRIASIDVERRLIRYADGRAPLQIDPAITVTVTAAESERHSATTAGVRYFPNGSSTGATIGLKSQRQSYEVRINWLTGRVSVNAVD